MLRIVVERVAYSQTILGVGFQHGPQLHRIMLLIVSEPFSVQTFSAHGFASALTQSVTTIVWQISLVDPPA
jgi:hypothetical protein